MVVAVGAHTFIGVTQGTVDQALQAASAPWIILQFDLGDADLATLLWAEHAFPLVVTNRLNPQGPRARPLRPLFVVPRPNAARGLPAQCA